MVNTVQILYTVCSGVLVVHCGVLCCAAQMKMRAVEEADLCLAVISFIRWSNFNLTCLVMSVSQCLARVTVPVNLHIHIVMAQYILCSGLDLHSESIHK